MISYAQNFEDVLLWRCFGENPKGFYIDVGAAHPLRDSVTYAFYRQGWSGLNVEPSELFFKLLQRFRPRDVCVQAVVGDRPGEATLFDAPGSGRSSIRPEVGQHVAASGLAVDPRTVPMTTLADLCEQYVDGPIDFLKVDVEGAEGLVLRGHDWTRWRPKVLVIEAVDPRTGKRSSNWKALLSKADYAEAYFDGLNVFFVADEHRDLARHLDAPPNVFDAIVRWREEAVEQYALATPRRAWRQQHERRLKSHMLKTPVHWDEEAMLGEWPPDELDRVPEAEQIARVFRQVLAREGSPLDVATWRDHAVGHDLSLREVIREFMASDEYAQLLLLWAET